MGAFKEAHGGTLKELYLSESQSDAEKNNIRDLVGWQLNTRQMCDVDLLLNGAFSPLDGFLGKADYDSVCTNMRLQSGTLWPMPVTLDVTSDFAESIKTGDRVALLDPEGVPIAIIDVAEMWTPDKDAEAEQVFGTKDVKHPGVAYLKQHANEVYLGGKVVGLETPTYYDFKLLRDSPSEMRARFRKLGWRRVVAYHTDSPLHRAEQEQTFRAARELGANLLIHPIIGKSRPGDVDHFTRVRCYEHVLEQYPEQTTTLSLLNLATRFGGPRETLWHAIIRKNYGCTHYIVGPSQAAASVDDSGTVFYGENEAQELFKQYEEELDITMVPLKAMAYAENRVEYIEQDQATAQDALVSLSDTEFQRRLQEGLDIPEWYSYPKVIDELRKAYPPKSEQGFTVFFTGLSGSGKSTVANALMVKLLENGSRPVTLLDGDIVRQHLSSELSFSKEHRDLNIQRIGYVASEITKNGGIAICAPIAPYTATRKTVRDMISPLGGFLEIHVATPIEVCEARDRKGLYAKARAGLIKGFTGIDDPYEVPENPEMSIDTGELSADLAAHRILIGLEKLGYLR